jgi:hypothetical protein
LGSGGSQFIHRDLRFTYTSIELRDYYWKHWEGAQASRRCSIIIIKKKKELPACRGEGSAAGLLLAARADSWELADSTSCWLFDVTKYGSFT